MKGFNALIVAAAITLGTALIPSNVPGAPATAIAGQVDGFTLLTTSKSLSLMETGGKEQFPLGINADEFEKKFGPAERRDEEPEFIAGDIPNPRFGGASLNYFTEGLKVHVDSDNKVSGFEIFIDPFTSFKGDKFTGARLVLKHGKTTLKASVIEPLSVRSVFKMYGDISHKVAAESLRSYDFKVNNKQVTFGFKNGRISSVAVFN